MTVAHVEVDEPGESFACLGGTDSVRRGPSCAELHEFCANLLDQREHECGDVLEMPIEDSARVARPRHHGLDAELAVRMLTQELDRGVEDLAARLLTQL